MIDDAALHIQAKDLAGSHYVCREDCWYSCPKSGECCNPTAPDACTCGRDTRAARIYQALRALLVTFEEAQRKMR
jgi:hypothetical protein